jgi:hypothetical protein
VRQPRLGRIYILHALALLPFVGAIL